MNQATCGAGVSESEIYEAKNILIFKCKSKIMIRFVTVATIAMRLIVMMIYICFDRCGEGRFDAWKLLELNPSLSSQNSAMLK